MNQEVSSRIIATPTGFAKKNLLYLQEVGSHQTTTPHISSRNNLNSYLFFVVTKGSGRLQYQDLNHNLTAGDCVFLDCNQKYEHESSKHTPWSLTWAHFNGNTAAPLYQYFLSHEGKSIFRPSDISVFLDLLEKIYLAQSKNEGNKEILVHQYLTDLIGLSIQSNQKIHKDSDSILSKIQEIQNDLSLHFVENITLDKLSEKYFISKYHLSREFKRITGYTIIHYLTNIRISHAKKLLRFSDHSLDSISKECGMSDANYFVKVFKNAEGMTPGEYRKKWL